MASESEAIDRGLELYLRSDAQLTALAPGGVWMDSAPQGTTGVFVRWRLQAAEDSRTHDRGGFERGLYEVTAVGLSASATAVVRASRRLRDLLEGASFFVEGYCVTRCEREQRLAFVEMDEDLRWHHRGAIWDVWAAPIRR